MMFRPASIGFILVVCGCLPSFSQVRSPQKISFSEGIFIDRLSDLDRFGSSIASVGDLDKDGVAELAVGAPLDDDGGNSITADRGAIWILFLRKDGTVRDNRKISSTRGGFDGAIDDNDRFGSSIAPLGDIDGDGAPEIAVGAPNDDDGGRDRGAVWILHLSAEGTVKSHVKLSDLSGGFEGKLDDGDRFGCSLAWLSDLDGDGAPELAIGAERDDDGGNDRGAVWVLSLRPEGTAKTTSKISDIAGGFDGLLDDGDAFGGSITAVGDLNRDGLLEVAVGAPFDDDGGRSLNANSGAVWLLSLTADRTVAAHQKISATSGGFGGRIDENDHFGASVAGLGDVNGDRVGDLFIGIPLDDDGGSTLAVNRGAGWIVFLLPTRIVGGYQKLSDREGDFAGVLDDGDQFGSSVAVLGDLDGDDVVDIAVGAPRDDDGGAFASDRGALWILFLRPNGTTRPETKISSTEGDFATTLDNEDAFGSSMAALGRIGENGDHVVAVGAPNDDDGGPDAGAVWLLVLGSGGSVASHRKVSPGEGGFPRELDEEDHFGASVASLGDFGRNGTVGLAVGAPDDDDGATDAGAVWLLFLNEEGAVQSHAKISATQGNFEGALEAGDRFGGALASVGDLDGDGVIDLAVGAPGDDDGGPDRGAVWLLFLNPDATVKVHVKIHPNTDGFEGMLGQDAEFGGAVTGVGDVNGDGQTDLAIGAPGDNQGSVWIVFLDSDRSVIGSRKLNGAVLGIGQDGLPRDRFGASLSAPGDLDGDGTPELIAGSSPAAGGGGIVRVIFLNRNGTVKSFQKHGATIGDFDGRAVDNSRFGGAVAVLGDLDGDGIEELGVGSPADDDGGVNRGAIWISFTALIAPPFVDEVSVSPELPIPGDRLRVSARIVAANGVQSAAINFRSSGDTDFLTAPLDPIDEERFELVIPSFVTGTRGIEYFITAQNLHGQETRSPSSGVVSLPIFIPDGMTLPIANGSAAEAYRLYSVPLDMENTSARAMLEGGLGPYDKKKWRFYGYNGAVHRHEFDAGDMDLRPGDAFWLLVRDPGTSVTTGPGTTVSTSEPFRVPLHPGWNYVGNPYNFSVPLSRLRTHSGQPVDARTYEGSWSVADRGFEALTAYAVFSDGRETTDTLVIDPDLTGLRPDSLQTMSGKNSAATGAGGNRGSGNWTIHIHATSGRASDTDNVAAISSSAASDWDSLDKPEPPVIGDYVSVYFSHPEWDRTTARFSTDARPVSIDGEVWDFEIRTAVPGPVELRFEKLETVPSEFTVLLVDPELQVRQDLRAINRYVLASAGPNRARSLQLAAGPSSAIDSRVDATVEQPMHHELFQNYPNPFDRVTTIRYALSRTTKVSVTVFDILGERVARLIRGVSQPAGYHHVVWDGRNDAAELMVSGIYFVRMEAGSWTATLPIAIVR